ncbi:ras guanine nucleotide exchange factor domain-containing protein [Radiomyces spectabilis]|uniref:ras guanine nucleotide exchange factor domain-containing protein n=1 Tax=Radiomyces spectabilis TaxID=64574 RepID=UPI00221E6685|nr:ras guanine nucleotide exchange factor domain-containing protein [Radiomyces spectabilis]KAI8379251.1 ras guanine nucleotide exchange factor domain-containing protein [Radiomyces spectabilis]
MDETGIRHGSDAEPLDDAHGWPYRQQQPHWYNDINKEKDFPLSLTHDDIAHPSKKTLPATWILQTTEDGSEVYYFNVVTKEMRYSVPPDDFDQANHDPVIIADHSITTSPFYASFDALRPTDQDLISEDQAINRPVRPARATHRSEYMARPMDEQSILSAATATTSSSSTAPSLHALQSSIEEQIPPNWIRKTTPKGRTYYCNVLTDQTTWSLDHIDPITGALLKSAANVSPSSSSRHTSHTSHRLSTSSGSVYSHDIPPPMSWAELSNVVAQAIQGLRTSVEQEKSHFYCDDVALVVRRIRLMLYVSNCVDKENSPYLKHSKLLRSHHRALLAAIAKLILSAKVASASWPPPNAGNKLLLDADEVLVAGRNFISTAQEMRLEVVDDRPKVLQDSPSFLQWRTPVDITDLSGKKADPATTILVLADNVRGAMTSFIDSIREAFASLDPKSTSSLSLSAKIRTTAPLLVAQFRNLSSTISQFLHSVEDAITTTRSAHATQFASSKQAIYTSMGSLFIASQIITKDDLPPSDLQATLLCIEKDVQSIEGKVVHICAIARQLLEESKGDMSHRGPLRSPSEDDILARPSQDSSRFHINGTIPEFDRDSFAEPSLYSPVMEVPHDDNASDLSDFTTQSRHAKDKLAKFFGEDTIAAAKRRDTLVTTKNGLQDVAVLNPVAGVSHARSERPDFLGADYNNKEIIFNMEGNVKGGTVSALVQRLTQHDQLDSKFITTFLLTYRSFCSTEELFDNLFRRYMLTPPADLNFDELELWKEKKLKLVRLRVFNVIKSWLETYYNEEEDRMILPRLLEFADTVVRESMQFGSEQLIKLIKKRIDAEDGSQIRKMTLNVRTSDVPSPILPKNMKRLRFLEIDPLELARQLTIMDSKLYSRIRPVECLDKNWGKSESDNIAINVKASIEYSNQVTAWVTDSILSKEEVRKRANVCKHWIYVAEKCRTLNNFNTCMAILSAFDNSSIGRLRRTWEMMSTRTMQLLTGIRRLMGANKNFTEYREIIHKVNPPCIPFLGIYLQDLTFIEDGNSSYLKKSNNLINFSKRMKTADVIRELQQHQSTPYLLQAVPDIQEFIKTHLQSSRDDETLYNLSLAVEPR